MFHDCVESCPEKLSPLYNTHTCRTCKEVNPDAPYWDTLAQKCTACPNYELQKDDLCVTCDQVYTSRPYSESRFGTCKSCPSSSPIWDWNTRTCSYECRATIELIPGQCIGCFDIGGVLPVLSEDGKRCEACPDSAPIWIKEPWEAVGSCRPRCPDATPYWDSQK